MGRAQFRVLWRAAIVLLVLASLLGAGGCGDDEDPGVAGGGDREKAAGAKAAEAKALRPADVITCLEVGTEVREDRGELANERRFAVASRQRGYLDADFADLYFFDDAAARRAQMAQEVKAFETALQDPKQRKMYEDAQELGLGGDPRARKEAYGNVLVAYSGSEDTRDKGLAASCLSAAGEREDLNARARR